MWQPGWEGSLGENGECAQIHFIHFSGNMTLYFIIWLYPTFYYQYLLREYCYLCILYKHIINSKQTILCVSILNFERYCLLHVCSHKTPTRSGQCGTLFPLPRLLQWYISIFAHLEDKTGYDIIVLISGSLTRGAEPIFMSLLDIQIVSWVPACPCALLIFLGGYSSWAYSFKAFLIKEQNYPFVICLPCYSQECFPRIPCAR